MLLYSLSTVSSRKRSVRALNLCNLTQSQEHSARGSLVATGRCDDAQLRSIAMEAHAFKELRLTSQKHTDATPTFRGWAYLVWINSAASAGQLTASTHREALHEPYKTATYCSIIYLRVYKKKNTRMTTTTSPPQGPSTTTYRPTQHP